MTDKTLTELKEFIATFKDNSFPLESVIKLNKSFYLLNSSAQQLLKQTKEEPVSAGLFLGVMKPKFTPSIALLRMLEPLTDKKIVLNEKSAWLFVCGRDAFENNIIKGDTKSNSVIVLDESGEVIGLALKSKNLYNNIKHSGEFLKNK